MFTTIFFVESSCVYAAKKNYQVENFKVSFEAPEGWQELRGYLGRDITLLGPKFGAKRDTIFIEVTDAKRINFSEEKKAASEYKKIKSEWLKKKAGKLKFFNLSKEISYLERKYLYHEVGYILNKKSYLEGNLFLKCSEGVGVTISFLTLEDKSIAFQKSLKGILSSLECSLK